MAIPHRTMGASATLILAMAPAIGHGQGLMVTPTIVEIPAGRTSAAMELRNRANAPMTVQLSGFRWQQSGNQDVLTDDPVLIVSPSIATIAPGKGQTFRIMVPKGARAQEASWRVVLDELPSATMPRTILSVRLRLSMPVFAAADGGNGAPALQWRTEDGILTARNLGTRRIRFGALALDGRALPLDGSPYLLPGAEHRWRVDASRALHLAGTGDMGPIHVLLPQLAAQ